MIHRPALLNNWASKNIKDIAHIVHDRAGFISNTFWVGFFSGGVNCSNVYIKFGM